MPLYVSPMRKSYRSQLLAVDAAINLLLGGALLLLPSTTISFFGLPTANSPFYVTVLGAVLFGIGIALWLERRNEERGQGLGLTGALAINVLAASTVLFWLVMDPLDLPTRGYIVLSIVVTAVFGTAFLELLAILRK